MVLRTGSKMACGSCELVGVGAYAFRRGRADGETALTDYTGKPKTSSRD